MDSHVKQICIDDHLLDSVKDVWRDDYVLVMGEGGELSGIITASDFTDQFNKLADPFLRVEEIEMQLRRLTKGKFKDGQLKAAAAEWRRQYVTSVHHLGLGDFCRLLIVKRHWRRLRLSIDREKFVGCLRSVKKIRNTVMHFDSKGLSPEESEKLTEMGRFLGGLAS